MSIYSKKQKWKFFLALAGGIIVLASLWYSNQLVRKNAQEERQKVTLWAQAIQRKAKIVSATKNLFNKIADGEHKKLEIWAKANKLINTTNQSNLTFLVDILASNTTIPVIVVDDKNRIVTTKNIDPTKAKDSSFLNNLLAKMKAEHPPIVMNIWKNKKQWLYYSDSKILTALKEVLKEQVESYFQEIINSSSVPVVITDSSHKKVIASGNIISHNIHNPKQLESLLSEMASQNKPIAVYLDNHTNYIYYKESALLRQLRYYPYFMFGIMAVFLIVAYILFSTARKAEQNQVWVGMAKETAHQLGTPLSSLMAWNEILESKGIDQTTLTEINKDLQRLDMITDRFSKIGAQPKLEPENVFDLITQTIQYLRSRISGKIELTTHCEDKSVMALISPSLLSWVIENLIKNAADAMESKGKITVEINSHAQEIIIDITDTGKGIARRNYKTIFEPGYTTKKRGWGLGLSLAKRIIENYHKGKIFVKNSVPHTATTFRIVLSRFDR